MKLHIAAANGFDKVAKFLLDNNVDVNAKDDDGWQPIHAAACWAHVSQILNHSVVFFLSSYKPQGKITVIYVNFIQNFIEFERKLLFSSIFEINDHCMSVLSSLVSTQPFVACVALSCESKTIPPTPSRVPIHTPG